MIYAILAAMWLSIGMFCAGINGASSIPDAILTAAVWPFIPAYLLGSNIHHRNKKNRR